MKKAIALLLCLLMMVSLAACGGNANVEDTKAPVEQNVAAEPTTAATEQPEASTAPVETEPVVTEPAETEPAFDTGWAGEAYVMPIPAPPVAEFEVMEGGARFGGVAIQVSAKDVQDLTNDEVAAYRQTLESLGFVNNVYEKDFDSAHGYEFSAQNENGDNVYITYPGSYFILIFEFAK